MPGLNLSESKVLKTQEVVTSWERLEKKDCISTYGARFLSGRTDLVLITDTQNLTESHAELNGSLLAYEVVQMNELTQTDFGNDPLEWLCDDSIIPPPNLGRYPKCTPNLVDRSNWTVYKQKVQYCRSEKVEEHCQLNFNQAIGIVVVSCNFVKFCCMIIAATKFQRNQLCTVGYVRSTVHQVRGLYRSSDATESFLARPDPTTARLCHWSKSRMAKKVPNWPKNRQKSDDGPVYKSKVRRWSQAASLHRQLGFVLT